VRSRDRIVSISDDQRAADAGRAAASAAAARAERLHRLGARRVQRRRHGDEDRGQRRHAEGDAE